MGAASLLNVMIIKLDTLAVPAKHAIDAKTWVKLSFPPPLKRRGKISFNS